MSNGKKTESKKGRYGGMIERHKKAAKARERGGGRGKSVKKGK